MNEIYFPSCNFSAASPEAAKKIRAFLAERMPVAGCCRVEKEAYVAGAKAIYFCQACRETIEAKMGTEMSIWIRTVPFPGRITAALLQPSKTAGAIGHTRKFLTQYAASYIKCT